MNQEGPTLQFLIEDGWHHGSICMTLDQYGIKRWQLRMADAQISANVISRCWANYTAIKKPTVI